MLYAAKAGVPKGIHQGSSAHSNPLIHDANRYTSELNQGA